MVEDTTWRIEMTDALEENGELWADIEAQEQIKAVAAMMRRPK